MSSRFGPIEITCDAPPYGVVRACGRLGIQFPEDVRWCQVNHLHQGHSGWRSLLSAATWKRLLGIPEPPQRCCPCGESLPALEKCVFTLASGKVVSYLIGQCRRCHTVFWDDA